LDLGSFVDDQGTDWGAMPRGGTFREGGTFEGRANGLSRMNLKFGLGFKFWLRLDLPYVLV